MAQVWMDYPTSAYKSHAPFVENLLHAFDWVIYNGDRHGGNQLWLSPWQMRAIDHSIAFDTYTPLTERITYIKPSPIVHTAMRKLLQTPEERTETLRMLGMPLEKVAAIWTRAALLWEKGVEEGLTPVLDL